MRSFDRGFVAICGGKAGVRAAAYLPLRPEGAAAAAHIIGYEASDQAPPKA